MGLCMEFNAQQLLFEAFSHIMRIFGGTELQTESTFPFQYNIRFETYQSLELLSSTLEQGRRVHPLTLLYRIHGQQLLFEPFSDIMHIFGSVEHSSERSFLHHIFRTHQSENS